MRKGRKEELKGGSLLVRSMLPFVQDWLIRHPSEVTMEIVEIAEM